MAVIDDPFGGQEPVLGDPYDRATVVNLGSDFTPGQLGRGLYVGGLGDVKVDLGNSQGPISTGVLFKAVPVGTVLRIRVLKVYSTANGTTASNLLLLG